jgi:hypothetical protein
MQQLIQAYADTIWRLGRDYGPWVAGIVVVFLVGHSILKAIARVRVGRGPGEP